MTKNKIALFVTAAMLTIAAAASGCAQTDGGSKPSDTTDGQSAADTTAAETTAAETTAAETAEPDSASVYDSLLASYYDLIVNGPDEDGISDGQTGVYEAVSGMDSGAALESVGYSITDISGDGVPELLIGSIAENNGGVYLGSQIYAVYTVSGDAPVLSFEGWARSCYRTMGGGKFFYQGSGGAAINIFGVYSISSDGTALVCEDFYYTNEKADDASVIGMYHNTTGEITADAAEEMDITSDEFSALSDNLGSGVQSIELLPFSGIKQVS